MESCLRSIATLPRSIRMQGGCADLRHQRDSHPQFYRWINVSDGGNQIYHLRCSQAWMGNEGRKTRLHRCHAAST